VATKTKKHTQTHKKTKNIVLKQQKNTVQKTCFLMSLTSHGDGTIVECVWQRVMQSG